MSRVRLALCQLNSVVGDLDGNAARIVEALAEAEAAGADIAVFPELSITGYPPEDLVERPAFVAANLIALDEVVRATGRCAAVIGFVDRIGERGRANAAALAVEGRVVASYHKRILPNYGVFDEQRWFAPGTSPVETFVVAGVTGALSVCEDVWVRGGPVAAQAVAGARLICNINASPYSAGRRDDRLAMLRERVEETGCTIAYVNQVGGQDELVFDGGSMVVAPDGTLVASARQFVEEILVADVDVPDQPARPAHPDGGSGARRPPSVVVTTATRGTGSLPGTVADVPRADAEVYDALVLGTRDYVCKNGFTDAVIGLSGGIDSSLVAVVATDALGPEHVHGVAMPSRYSSEGSVADAATLAANLGIDLVTVPIEPAHGVFGEMLAAALGTEPAGLTDENLQSRIRGVLLMAISNATGRIVLTTGNKSEMATGYSTLYGDSAGGFAVIKDVPKTLVYALCRYRNAIAGGELVPAAVLEKPPSAELRPDQRDVQSLPPYEVLDPVLAGYVEGDRSVEELVAEGFDPDVAARVADLVDRAEYKRRQMPPGVRITTKAFGKDRRMPITNRYHGTAPGADR